MRKILSGIVALYVLVDCIAYSRGSRVFLLIVTFLILLDMAGQVIVMNNLRKKPTD